MKEFFVYIMASYRKGTLYTGVTSSLEKRVVEHKQGIYEGFTHRYKVHKLVYYERFPDARNAILREKRIKTWKREWKIELIENLNPEWKDLAGFLEGNGTTDMASGRHFEAVEGTLE